MVLKSYAKINLFLSVNQKLSNGFHNIQSIFCLINLSDKIFIKKILLKLVLLKNYLNLEKRTKSLNFQVSQQYQELGRMVQ